MKILYEARYKNAEEKIKCETFLCDISVKTIIEDMMCRAKNDGRVYLDYFDALVNCFPSEVAYYIDKNVFDKSLGELVRDFSAQNDEKLLGIEIKKVQNKEIENPFDIMDCDDITSVLDSYFKGARTICL